MKKSFPVLSVIIAILCMFTFCSCSLSDNKTPSGTEDPPSVVEPPVEDPPDDPPKYEKITGDKYFLRADGATVKNADGERVMLRGVNAGGLFVTEHWMTGFLYGKTPSNDYRSLTQTFIERFGEEKTKALWDEYRANWWTEQDFINCADMGFNVIRLPFTYMNVDFAAVTSYDEAGKEYDFSALDAFVEKAAEYGMYTILDLHGAYGSQNGQDHSGQVIGSDADVGYFSDDDMMALTVKLWGALAEHYKDVPAVAGYDILNEPGEKAGATSKRHWDHYNEIFKAIRAKDTAHIVIMESCWDAENLPLTSSYGWYNTMYSFHHYAGTGIGYEAYKASWETKISAVEEVHSDVPLQMGEFTNYTSVEQWDYVLGYMRSHGWHWAAWTYKVWGNMPWGVVNVHGSNSDKIDASADDYDTILEKFKLLNTNAESCVKYTFSNGVTLEQIYKNHCVTKKYERVLSDGTYSMLNDEGYLGMRKITSGASVLYLADSSNNATPITVTKTDFSDGSVYLSATERLSVTAYNGRMCLAAAGDVDSDAAYFFVEKDGDDEYRFISASTGMYLRVGDDRIMYADATREQATAFYCFAN